MIRYMSSCPTGGKFLEWETVIRGNISAAIASGYAKSMMGAINSDLEKINRMRSGGHERTVEHVGKCDASGIIMSPSGNYMVICYSILVNRMSEKNISSLKDIGFVETKQIS